MAQLPDHPVFVGYLLWLRFGITRYVYRTFDATAFPQKLVFALCTDCLGHNNCHKSFSSWSEVYYSYVGTEVDV